MSEDEDIDGLAAEYVLGSLAAAERAAVEARRGVDRELDAAIRAWERRLCPLSEREPGLAPPGHLFDAILTRISAQAAGAAGSGQVVPLRRNAGRKWWPFVIGGSAACLALAVLWIAVQQPRHRTHQLARMDCSRLYKEFWENLDRDKYAKISAEQLAGISRMALRAYDACQAGDENDAKALFERLERMKV
jgi:hypothetical protein